MTTSSDGFLVATADATYASVDLDVNVTGLPAATVNLVANPNSESASVFTTFSNATGPTSATQARTGARSTALTASSAASMSGTTPKTFPVVAGRAYVGSFWARPNGTARNVTCSVIWVDAAGATVSTTTGSVSVETGGAFKQYFATATAPAGAVAAGINASVTSPASGEIHFIDDLQLEPGSTASTTFCDGSQPGCRWSGPVNNSISVRDPIGLIVVTRTANGVTANVRGLDMVPAPGGGANAMDHEAPLGVLCTYQASIYSTAGVLYLTTTTATATVVAASYTCWLKSLTDPALSVHVHVMQFPDWTDDIALGVFPVLGRSAPVTVADVRQAGRGSMTLKTNSTAEIVALRALLASPGPYLLNSAASAEDDVYVAVGAATRARITKVVGDGLRTFQLALIQVDRPETAGVAIAMPGHTYADSLVAWPLYSGRTGAYASRI